MPTLHRPFFNALALAGLFALVACSGGLGSSSALPDMGAQPQSAAQAPSSSESPSSESESESESPLSPETPQAANAESPAASGQAHPGQSPAALAALRPMATKAHFVCPKPAAPGHYSCDSILRTDVGGPAPNGYHGEDFARAFAAILPAGKQCSISSAYCASDLQAAYGLIQAAKNHGTGVTIAIADSFGYATAESDLAVYRKTMGLRACTVASGCLKIVNQEGQTSPLPTPNPNPSDDWRPEQSLDLDMVSAICPNCKILLVQANDDYSTNLDTAVDEAVSLGAAVVSNSYGGNEVNSKDPAYNHAGHTIVASSGDYGYGTQQPCSYIRVVCVGGTHLERASNTRGWSETAWSGTGSGCSKYVRKPEWQHDKGCTKRTETDISAVADPATGVAIYESPNGWGIMGGTSASSPIVAAIFALANNNASIVAPEWIWRHGGTSVYHDVTSGRDGQCPSAALYLCVARAGYDGPSGWGTPNGIAGF